MRYVMTTLRWTLFLLFAIVEACDEMQWARHPPAFFALWALSGLFYLLAAAIMCTHAAARPLIASPVAYTVIVAALFCTGLWFDRPGLLSRAYEDGAIFGPLAVSLALALRLWPSGQPASRVQARSIARVLALTALACLVYIVMGVFHALAGWA